MSGRAPSAPTPIILNPAAGGGSAGRNWPRLEAILAEEGIAITLHRTTRSGEARTLADQLADGCERLLLVGGDGTVNEVVNGLMDARRRGAATPAFGVIPATTGNDFARTIGMPLPNREAVRALRTSRPRALDVGRVDYSDAAGQSVSRHFVLACAAGLAAEVAENANRGSKRFGGTLPFLTSLLRLVVGYEACHVTAKSGDEIVWDGAALAAVVANAANLGGGMKIAPDARIDDGELDFVCLGDRPLWQRLRHLPRIYTGTHLQLEGVLSRTVTELHLTSDPPALLGVDGETLGRLPARISIVPSALRVLVPA
jgi:YegS/Rv2252/BmrU family lipid kinase